MPVANAVIPITLNAARTLVLKDFAYEKDENKLIRALT